MKADFLTSLGTLAASGKTAAELLLQASLAPADRFTGWSLEDRNPETIRKLMPYFGWFYDHYFHVKTDGWEHIPPKDNVLLIGSHNGGLGAPDTVMMTYDWLRQFGPERPAYALMDARMWRALPGVARLATQVGTLQAHPQMAIAALEQKASLLIYPGGVQDVFRPHSQRHRIHLNHHLGFIKLALQYAVPIVPLISYGAHDTLFVLADIYPQLQRLHQQGMPWPFGIDPGTVPIYLGLPWGVAIGPLPNIPLPVPLHTRVCPPITFERYGGEAAHDREYVETCYRVVRDRMQQALDQLVAENENAPNVKPA